MGGRLKKCSPSSSKMVVAASDPSLAFGPTIDSRDSERTAGAVDLPYPMKDRIDRWVEALNRQSSRVLFALVYLVVVPFFWLFFRIGKVFSYQREAHRATEWKKKPDLEESSRKEFFDSMG